MKIKEKIEEIKKIQKETHIQILKEWEMEKLKNLPNLNKVIYDIQDRIMELVGIITGSTIAEYKFKKGWLYIPNKEVKNYYKWMKPYNNGFVIKVINY